MNPQDPLAALHPLRQPELIGWWPLAPGWWMLLGVALLSLVVLVYLLRRWRKKNAYRRRALRQLQELQRQFLAQGYTADFVGQTNALLKSVAVLAYPHADVAGQHGEQWRAFLNRSLPPSKQLQSDFDCAIYQRDCPDIDAAQVYRAAQAWIADHKGAR